MSDQAMFDNNDTANAIAEYWSVDIALLESTEWVLEEMEGNDGEVYGYLVRFSEDTDPEILDGLGIARGSYTRSVSLNAFD